MKKQYIIPVVETMQFNTVLMQKTGEASLLPGPGGNAPGRNGAGPNRTPVF